MYTLNIYIYVKIGTKLLEPTRAGLVADLPRAPYHRNSHILGLVVHIALHRTFVADSLVLESPI